MIIRIFTEGQYELSDAVLPRLNELDVEAQSALESGEKEQFRLSYDRLLGYIREEGTPLLSEDLRGSDLMLPPPDISLAAASAEFHGHGLVPD